jgi:hypothetical protein
LHLRRVLSSGYDELREAKERASILIFAIAALPVAGIAVKEGVKPEAPEHRGGETRLEPLVADA